MSHIETSDDFEKRECYICDGTGTHYDPTNADKISTGGKGRATCFKCHGNGYTLHLTREALRRRFESWS